MIRRVPNHFRPLPSKKESGGFTLLELLLAFVVFALGFATVLEILSGSMRNTVRARHYSEAALTAQSLMDQLGLEYFMVKKNGLMICRHIRVVEI